MSRPNKDITWGEFKALISDQITDDTEVAWIDMHGVYMPEVGFYKDGSVHISDGDSRYDGD